MASYGVVSSDEVAEDYRRALEDLTMNSRYEISNLTVIAKENTEHAMAISDALKAHIKATAPAKKLPAFYVLDSVVKNVGTPYTLFFGRGLFATFMEAYAMVDQGVRRKMEEMLKTWKEPVPGSIDSRPVFPADVTRPIENALIKHRTSAIQAQQEYSRREQQILGRVRGTPGPPYRDTPTPPQIRPPNGNGPYGPPQVQQYPPQQMNPQYGQGPPVQQWQQPYPGQNTQYPAPPQHYQAPQTQQYPQAQQYPQVPQPPFHQQSPYQPQPPQVHHGAMGSGSSLDTLNNDIANLIVGAKADFARNPYDGSSQGRLKTLLDLQSLLSTRQISQSELGLIRDQVAQQMAQQPLAQSQAPPTPVPVPVRQVAPPVTLPQAQQPMSSLPGPNDLAAILARQAAGTPQVPTPPPAASSTPDPTSLIEKLRAAGLLPGAASTNSPAPPAKTPVTSTAQPSSNLPALPFVGGGALQPRQAFAEIQNDVQLKPASLKIPRPHLISSLYERLGVPCTQCGRRFQSDEEGKAKKAAHMDWHFRVHQRMTDAEKRGQHRSWNVDEMDWIKSRETADDHTTNENPPEATESKSAGSNDQTVKQQYIPAPNDPALANSVCPICQEKFDTIWLDSAQEFVWMDAKRVGPAANSRIYHASCYAETTRDEVGARGGGGTQELTVLGKRKAEADSESLKKVKMEPGGSGGGYS